jgi:hypothetical protein
VSSYVALYAEALADVRSLRLPEPSSKPGAPRTPRECCTQDRAGWLWHWRHGTPACAESRRANAAWAHENRVRRPNAR